MTASCAASITSHCLACRNVVTGSRPRSRCSIVTNVMMKSSSSRDHPEQQVALGFAIHTSFQIFKYSSADTRPTTVKADLNVYSTLAQLAHLVSQNELS